MAYKNTPRGTGGLVTDVRRRRGAFVSLDHLVATGNRAHRRLALKMLAKQTPAATKSNLRI